MWQCGTTLAMAYIATVLYWHYNCEGPHCWYSTMRSRAVSKDIIVLYQQGVGQNLLVSCTIGWNPGICQQCGPWGWTIWHHRHCIWYSPVSTAICADLAKNTYKYWTPIKSWTPINALIMWLHSTTDQKHSRFYRCSAFIGVLCKVCANSCTFWTPGLLVSKSPSPVQYRVVQSNSPVIVYNTLL